jgi:hypothetical protein
MSNTSVIEGTIREVVGIRSDISTQGTPYTIAEINFSYKHKGKTRFVNMVAFDDIAKSLKYFRKNARVQVEFYVSSKRIGGKPYTSCVIESICKSEQEETEQDENN